MKVKDSYLNFLKFIFNFNVFLDLLKLFWNNHEYGLTTRIKKQYASIIFYHNDDQKKIAEGKLPTNPFHSFLPVTLIFFFSPF